MVVMMDIVGRDMLWTSFWLSTPHVKNYYTEPQYMYTFASLSLASSREAQTNYTVRVRVLLESGMPCGESSATATI